MKEYLKIKALGTLVKQGQSITGFQQLPYSKEIADVNRDVTKHIVQKEIPNAFTAISNFGGHVVNSALSLPALTAGSVASGAQFIGSIGSNLLNGSGFAKSLKGAKTDAVNAGVSVGHAIDNYGPAAVRRYINKVMRNNTLDYALRNGMDPHNLDTSEKVGLKGINLANTAGDFIGFGAAPLKALKFIRTGARAARAARVAQALQGAQDKSKWLSRIGKTLMGTWAGTVGMAEDDLINRLKKDYDNYQFNGVRPTD